MCPSWHVGILDVPGVFRCLALLLCTVAKDFDLFMFRVGQGEVQFEPEGLWA